MTDRLQRIYALFLRQLFLVYQSPTRLIAIIFWPTLIMMIWGFFNQFLYQETKTAQFALSTLLGATLLLNIVERSNINVMMGFLEDVWSRNVGNLLFSPLRRGELVCGLIINGFFTTVIGIAVAFTLAYIIFGYNILTLGVPLMSLMINLFITGWWIGIMISALIVRFGATGEWMGFMAAFLMTPFICAYYPVSIFPHWLQHIAWALPPTYSFEALRGLIAGHGFDHTFFIRGMALNAGYFALSLVLFFHAIEKARKRGGLFSLSE